jgi:putative transposase
MVKRCVSTSRPHRKHVRLCSEPGHAHFLTCSCDLRLPLLSKDRSRNWFVEAVADARTRLEFDLWAWVIMPEHVHLLIYPRRPVYDMSEIVWQIKRPVGVKAIRYLRKHAPQYLEGLTVRHRNRTYRRFWQAGPGMDRDVTEPKAVPEVIDYIHMNPVRRGLVERPEDWPWSSARDWLGVPGCPLPVDKTVPPIVEIP